MPLKKPTKTWKKLEPTPAYSDDLLRERDGIVQRLSDAQKDLYKYTATSKLGELPFEMAREECLKVNKELIAIDKEILRVGKALTVAKK